MDNQVALFFDSVAGGWDNTNAPDAAILEMIADISGAAPDKSVLDAGCGTGVMFPLYLSRNVKQITAVDISEKMLMRARKKYPSDNISFVCCDILYFDCDNTFDCVIVHNAFPHFIRQSESLEKLKKLTAAGGRLTIAHSISRADVLKCHENIPDVSVELPEACELAAMFGEDFENFTVVSDERCYIVSAEKKK